MVSVPPDPVPLLVSLKAVDPAEYPYYGTADLEPAMPLQQALQGDSAVVADEFLIRLNARVGQTLRLGGRNFTITAASETGARPDQRRHRDWAEGHDLAGRTGAHRIAGAGQPRRLAIAGQAAGQTAARAHRRCRDGRGAQRNLRPHCPMRR